MTRRSWLQDYGYRDVVGSPTMRQLIRAFQILNYDFAYGEERELAAHFLAQFRQRWSNLSTDTLVAVARRFVPAPDEHVALGYEAILEPQTTEEQDTLFALAVLGALKTPEMSQELAPFLNSPRAQERWLAAFGLAAVRDERAIPALEPMLVEFVGPMQPWTPERLLIYIFQTLRHRLLGLLPEWGDPRLIPIIRAGLIATVRAEEIEVPEPHGSEQEFVWHGHRYTGQEAWRHFLGEQLFWVDDEHLFVYALGRMGAFGALEGVPTRRGIYSWVRNDEDIERWVPESRADTFRASIWRIHMCLGALESRFRGRVGTFYEFSDVPELAEAVEQLLADKFGMDKAARRQVIEDCDRSSWAYWALFLHRWDVDLTGENDDGEEKEEQESDDSPDISLEDMEAQDLGW